MSPVGSNQVITISEPSRPTQPTRNPPPKKIPALPALAFWSIVSHLRVETLDFPLAGPRLGYSRSVGV